MIRPSPLAAYQFRGGAKRAAASPAVARASRTPLGQDSIYGDDDMNDHAKNQTMTGGADADAAPAAGYPVSALLGGGAGMARFAHLAVPAGLVLERRRHARRSPAALEHAMLPIGEARFAQLFGAVAAVHARGRSARRSKRRAKPARARRTRKARGSKN